MARFGKMREWDSKARSYATNLCALIPDSVDTGPLEQRVDALEACCDEVQSKLDSIESDVGDLEEPEPAEDWNMGFVADGVTEIRELGEPVPLDQLFDMSA